MNNFFYCSRNVRNNQVKWIPERAFHQHKSNASIVLFDIATNPIVKVHIDAFVNLRHVRKMYVTDALVFRSLQEGEKN